MALTTVRPQGMGFNTGRRNLIINGAMQVSQRGTDINTLTNGSIGADRFKTVIANIDDLAMDYDQSTDVPSGSGFANSLKLSVASAEGAIAADEYVSFGQRIEAQNLQHLKYGTSSGEKITLSFHVKSSVTGTYAISIFQQDASSSPDRRYHSKTYTISSANTWEYKTITIDPNTDDAIANDTGIGLRVDWVLSAGSNYTSGSNNTWGDITNWMVGHNASWITTSSATFFLTGVQLEVGENASDFEHRSFGEELAACQRYFCKSFDTGVTPGTADGNGAIRGVRGDGSFITNLFFPQEMRAAPTVTMYSPTTGASGKVRNLSGAGSDEASAAFSQGTRNAGFTFTSTSTEVCINAHFTAEAEL